MLNMLHPGLVMIAFGILILLIPDRLGMRKPLQILGPIVAAVGMTQLNENSSLSYGITDNLKLELLHVDRLTMAFMIIFCFIAIANVIYGYEIAKRKEAGMSLVYAGSMMSVVLAGDLISFIVFWEIAAFASTYIIYSNHTRKSSRASFRYLLVHAFGGNMLLVGFIFLLVSNGNAIINMSEASGLTYWFILIGIAINVAIPPLNGWLPDAYPEATIGGTPFLASFTTKAAVYALIRFYAGTEILVYFGVFMSIYAALMALLENDIRRLLSHHIVSQVGMMVAAIGVGSHVGIDGATAHVIANILYKGILMMAAGAVIYTTGKRKITELGGMAKKLPLVSGCFLVAALSIAGFPFTSGFASKALIMDALHEGGYGAAAMGLTIAGVGTLLSITLKLNYFVFFGKSDKDVELVNKLPRSMEIAMVIVTIATLTVGFVPSLLYGITMYASTAHVFAIGHIAEYLAIFIGGTVPFVLYIKKMAPHDEISLDFDWLYRKPLGSAVQGISKAIYAFMLWFEKYVLRGASYMRTHMGDPTLWTSKSSVVVIKSMSFENEERAIGDVIQVAVFMVALMFAAIPFVL